MKRISQIGFGAVLLLLTLNAGRLVYRAWHPVHVRAASPAYTVMRTEYVYDGQGVLRATNSYLEAVRGDGSRMNRQTTARVQHREIVFANGDVVRTNELSARKSTFPGVGVPPMRDSNSSCTGAEERQAGWQVDGNDTVGGYRTVRVVNAKMGVTLWYALDWGCALVQQKAGGGTGESLTEQKLTALIPGEPDLALFQVGPGFAEVPPSEITAAAHPNPHAMERMDQRYHEIRERAAAKK